MSTAPEALPGQRGAEARWHPVKHPWSSCSGVIARQSDHYNHVSRWTERQVCEAAVEGIDSRGKQCSTRS